MRWAIVFGVLIGCGGGGSSPPCSGLALADCRVTEGCAPDLCGTCFCSLAYRGCLAEGDTPDECPQLGCPGASCCTTQEQCTGPNETCVPPGTPQGCGACNTFPGDCMTDTDCTVANTICEPIPCSCDQESQCVPGCVDSEVPCAVGTTCNPTTSRCTATECTVDADCPPDFECDPVCTRKTCTDDLDCDGFCVLGQCFTGERGECRLPSA
jgi:hypothetical protein